MKEAIVYAIEDLRDLYIARVRVDYQFVLPLADDDSEKYHPFYEIERRATAYAAMRTALNEHVFE